MECRESVNSALEPHCALLVCSLPFRGRCSPFEIVDDCKRLQLVRFRLGAHQLAVTAGAWKGIERTKRICKCCSMGIWRTKYISLLSVYLFYTDIRHQYHELVEGFAVQHNAGSGIIIDDTDSMMQTFLANNDRIYLHNLLSHAC